MQIHICYVTNKTDLIVAIFFAQRLNSHHFIWHLIYPTSSGQPLPRRGK